MNRALLRGVGYLLLFTVLYFIIISTGSYNQWTYLLLLILIGISIVSLNRDSLVSANSLFFIFFAYSVGLGPVILMRRNIQYNYNYFTVILGGLLCFSWGNAIASAFNKKRIIAKEDKTRRQFKIKRLTALRMAYAVSILAAFYYLYSNRHVLLGGNLQSGRMDAMAGNGMILYISQISIVVIPMMYDLYKKGKDSGIKLISKYEIIADLGIATITLLFSGFRALMMSLYVCLVLLYITKNKIKSRRIIGFGVAFVFIVETLGLIRSSLSGEALLMSNFFDSLSTSLFVNCINLKYVFTAFPSRVPFQYGYTYLINFIMLLPGPDPDFTMWLKEMLGLSFSGGGVTPTILGEFYINFGLPGIYVGMFGLGCFGIVIWNYFREHSETFLGAYFLWQFAHCASGGIANVIITVILFTIVYKVLIMFPPYLKRGTAYGK